MDIMEKFPSEKRLIDASKWDEFYQEMTKNLKPYDHYDDGYRDAMDNVDDWMDGNQVEADPVRHGYWENANGRPKTYIRKCSVCGKEAYFCGRGRSYKFCPNCGSNMDGESDE